MLIKLHKYLGLPGNEGIYINPNLVIYVEACSAQTIIHFEGGLTVGVAEPMQKVIKEIEKALG